MGPNINQINLPSVEETDRHLTPRSVRLTILLMIVIVSVALRSIDIQRGLWLDELHTSWSVNGSFLDVAGRAASGNQPPVYFYVVWLFQVVFGHSEWSLRIVSLISGVGLSLLAYRIAWELTRSAWPGLFAAFLIAIDPYFIEYSQEARPYALLQLAGLAQVLFFGRRLLETEQWQRGQIKSQAGRRFLLFGPNSLGLILSTTLCFFIHYTAILLTVSLAMIVILGNTIANRSWNRKRAAPLADLAFGILLCWPVVPAIINVARRKGNWELFVNDQFWTPSLGFQLAVYLIPGALAVAVASVTRKQNTPARPGFSALILFLVYFLPILLAWTALKIDVAALYHQRYFMIGWSGLILSAVIGVDRATTSQVGWVQFAGWLAGLAMLVGSLVFNPLLPGYLREGTMPFESSWRTAIEHLNQECPESQLLYLFPNLIEDRALAAKNAGEVPGYPTLENLNEYCLFPIQSLYQTDIPLQIPKSTLLRPRFEETDRERLINAERVVLLIRGDQMIIADVLNEFAEFGIQNKLFIKNVGGNSFGIRGAPGQSISVFEFSVVEETD